LGEKLLNFIKISKIFFLLKKNKNLKITTKNVFSKYDFFVKIDRTFLKK